MPTDNKETISDLVNRLRDQAEEQVHLEQNIEVRTTFSQETWFKNRFEKIITKADIKIDNWQEYVERSVIPQSPQRNAISPPKILKPIETNTLLNQQPQTPFKSNFNIEIQQDLQTRPKIARKPK